MADLESKLAFCLNDAHQKAFRLTRAMIFTLIYREPSKHIASILKANSEDESFVLLLPKNEFLLSYINELKIAHKDSCSSIADSFLENAKEFLESLDKPFSALVCVILSIWLTPPPYAKKRTYFS